MDEKIGRLEKARDQLDRIVLKQGKKIRSQTSERKDVAGSWVKQMSYMLVRKGSTKLLVQEWAKTGTQGPTQKKGSK